MIDRKNKRPPLATCRGRTFADRLLPLATVNSILAKQEWNSQLELGKREVVKREIGKALNSAVVGLLFRF